MRFEIWIILLSVELVEHKIKQFVELFLFPLRQSHENIFLVGSQQHFYIKKRVKHKSYWIANSFIKTVLKFLISNWPKKQRKMLYFLQEIWSFCIWHFKTTTKWINKMFLCWSWLRLCCLQRFQQQKNIFRISKIFLWVDIKNWSALLILKRHNLTPQILTIILIYRHI